MNQSNLPFTSATAGTVATVPPLPILHPNVDDDSSDEEDENLLTSSSSRMAASSVVAVGGVVSQQQVAVASSSSSLLQHQQELSWRMNRTDSLSDWTLTVQRVDEVGQTTGQDIYHIHKNVVAIGTRSSEYFHKMFQSWTEETKDAASVLSFHPLQASVLPDVLDYLYAPSEDDASELLQQFLCTSKATALYSVADYLQIQELKRRLRMYYKQNVQLHNLKLYYLHARTLQTTKIMEHVQAVTAKEICTTTIMTQPLKSTTTTTSSKNNNDIMSLQQQQRQQQQQENLGTIFSLAQVMELDFWLPVLETYIPKEITTITSSGSKGDSPDDYIHTKSAVSKITSIVLVAACAHQRHEVALTLEMFRKLTNATTALPVIDVHAAFPLLSLEKTLMDQQRKKEQQEQEKSIPGSSTHEATAKDDAAVVEQQQPQQQGLTSLQQHFVNSLLSLNAAADDNDHDDDNSSNRDGKHSSMLSTNPSSDSWVYNGNNSNNQQQQLTSLQERCVTAISRDWTSISYDDKCIGLLLSLENPYLISRIMVQALATAKEYVAETNTASGSSSKRSTGLGLLWPYPQRSKATTKETGASSATTTATTTTPNDKNHNNLFNLSWTSKNKSQEQQHQQQQGQTTDTKLSITSPFKFTSKSKTQQQSHSEKQQQQQQQSKPKWTWSTNKQQGK